MSIKGPKFNQTNGNLNRRAPNTDGILGLILQGVVPAPQGIKAYALGNVIKLNSPDDAVAYGFNTAYDANNSVIVYGHITEFFRENPNGTLWLMVVNQGVTMTEMCDKTQPYIWSLINAEGVNGQIKYVGCILNPNNAYTPTYTGGIDTDAYDAIPNAKALLDAAADAYIFLDGIGIGAEMSAGASVSDLQDLTNIMDGDAAVNADGVSILIGADPAVSALDPLFATYACIGTFLGMVSYRSVAECIGQTGYPQPDLSSGDISNAALGKFLSAGLSCNKLVSSFSQEDLTLLDAKGYIFVYKYPQQPGVYFSDSPCCTSSTSDYDTIEANRSINKMKRLVYNSLFPFVKGKIYLNDDGTVIPTQIAAIEKAGKIGLEAMVKAGELSGEDVYFDPTQKPIVNNGWSVKIAGLPVAIGRDIEVSIGFTSSL